MATIAAGQPAALVPPRSPRTAAFWAIALGGVAASAVAVSLALTSDHLREPGIHAALQVWALLGYVLAGVVAWWRRPESRFGPLMIAAGVVWFMTTLSSANYAVPYTVGIAFDLLPAVVFLHVFLAFPTGRLQGSYERVLVAVGYVTAFGAQLVGMALGGFGPDNLLELASEAGTAHSLLRVQLVVLSALAVVGIVVLALRRRHAGRPLRRSSELLVDAFVLGLAMVAVLFTCAAFGMVSGQIAFELLRRATFFVLGLAPLAFLVGLLDAHLARSAVGDLLVELRRDPAPADLRDALARALRDPSLTLVYWLPEFATYADLDGREVDVEKLGAGRAMTLIDRDGSHIAALLHEPALKDEAELLDAVTAAAAISLDNARLHAELRARLAELRGSRARIIEVAQKERQRLERDLHDGAQQRLIALSLDLSRLERRLGSDAAAKASLDQARRDIALSLAELRDVARGIHPAVVSGHGLDVALEQLVARAAVPVRLSVAIGERLPEPIEVAAFYLVSESLTNIAKHSGATTATVDVARQDGQVLVEVVDDGVGGADTEHGSGLRGLADRVEALEGRLRVWSPRGGGTRLRAEIPCAS